MPAFIIMNLFQPVLWLVLFTQIFKSLGNMPGIGSSYLQFFTPGVVIMTVLFGAMFSGMGMLMDIDCGILAKMLATPVTRVSIITGRVIASVVVLIIQVLIVLIISAIMGVHFATGIPGVLFALLLAALLGISRAISSAGSRDMAASPNAARGRRYLFSGRVQGSGFWNRGSTVGSGSEPQPLTPEPSSCRPHAATHEVAGPRVECGIRQRNFSGAEPVLRNWWPARWAGTNTAVPDAGRVLRISFHHTPVPSRTNTSCSWPWVCWGCSAGSNLELPHGEAGRIVVLADQAAVRPPDPSISTGAARSVRSGRLSCQAPLTQRKKPRGRRLPAPYRPPPRKPH